MASAFGAVLKKHRQAKALSQETLAEMADIHPTYLGMIERFEKNPTLNVAKSLAKGLGMPLTDLIREAEELQAKRR